MRIAFEAFSILDTKLALLRYECPSTSSIDHTNGVQKSRNSRLKDLEDKMSTNIYCTNLPIDWTEAVRTLHSL